MPLGSSASQLRMSLVWPALRYGNYLFYVAIRGLAVYLVIIWFGLCVYQLPCHFDLLNTSLGIHCCALSLVLGLISAAWHPVYPTLSDNRRPKSAEVLMFFAKNAPNFVILQSSIILIDRHNEYVRALWHHKIIWRLFLEMNKLKNLTRLGLSEFVLCYASLTRSLSRMSEAVCWVSAVSACKGVRADSWHWSSLDKHQWSWADRLLMLVLAVIGDNAAVMLVEFWCRCCLWISSIHH